MFNKHEVEGSIRPLEIITHFCVKFYFSLLLILKNRLSINNMKKQT